MGAKTSKCYSSYKSQPKVSKLFLNVPANGPHQTTLGIFEILSSRFLMIFFAKIQIHHCSLWKYQKPQLSGKQAIVEKKGMKFEARGYSYSA